MKQVFALACKVERKVAMIGEKIEGLVLLGIRLWMGEIFLQSGYNKLSDYLNGSGDNVVLLFSDIHPVPLLPAELAAPLATAGELVLGIMFVLGIMGRSAAFGLLVMTVVIQISLPLLNIHALWFLLFAVVVAYGPGAFSVDGLMQKKCSNKDKA